MSLPDLRPALNQSQQWMHDLIAAVRPDQLGLATPCSELDVRALVAHVYMGAARVRTIGEGGDPRTVGFPVEQLPDDLAAGYAALTSSAREVWTDDDLLGRTVRVPWGEMPGAFALAGYVMETLAHGWDLAVATDQPATIEPGLAALGLQVAQNALPAEPRGTQTVPFGPVVESGPDDDLTLQFVHWTGRG